MATSPSAVSGLPEGYTIEGQQATQAAPAPQGLPEGYALETENTPPSNQPQGWDAVKQARHFGDAKAIGEDSAKSAKLAAGGMSAAEAIPDLADFAIKKLAGNVLPGMESQAAKQTLTQALPKVYKFATDMAGHGLNLAGTYELLKHLMSDSKK